MADVLWKVLAAAIFIAVMVGLRYVLKAMFEAMNPLFMEGFVVGAMSVTIIYLLAHWVEKKGWIR
jgi:hypothetical protein